MDEHAKLQRTLSIILLLMGIRKYSCAEIMEKYDISVRTFHRYIATFRSVGIIVEQEDGLYQIRRIEPQLKELSELLHFSEEEALILNKAILAIDDNNQLKANLRKKLYAIYDFDRITETILHPEQANNIQDIIKAIKAHKQIVLLDYQSANSQKISSRTVEAFDFTTNYQMIWAFDLNAKKNKQFKVSRIKSIEILSNDWQHQNLHKKLPMDAFRISGEKSEECILNLSLRAGNLLVEEYPLAEQMMSKASKHSFQFKGPVFGYQGVGRFCMGLLDDIEIIAPKGLKDYTEKKMREYFNK